MAWHNSVNFNGKYCFVHIDPMVPIRVVLTASRSRLRGSTCRQRLLFAPNVSLPGLNMFWCRIVWYYFRRPTCRTDQNQLFGRVYHVWFLRQCWWLLCPCGLCFFDVYNWFHYRSDVRTKRHLALQSFRLISYGKEFCQSSCKWWVKISHLHKYICRYIKR